MDIVTSVAVSECAVDVDMLGAIQNTNYLLTIIIFCLIFFWLEKKIKNIIKRFTQTESGCK